MWIMLTSYSVVVAHLILVSTFSLFFTTEAKKGKTDSSDDDSSEDEKEVEAPQEKGRKSSTSPAPAEVSMVESTESPKSTPENTVQGTPMVANKYVQDMQERNTVARPADEKKVLVQRYAMERVFRGLKFPEDKDLPVDGKVSQRIAQQYDVPPNSANHVQRWPNLRRLIISKICSRRSAVATAMRIKYLGKWFV